MKKIILLFLLLLTMQSIAKKAFVNKHYIEYEYVTDLYCIDSSNCFAFVEYGGISRIYNSTDQGDTWDMIYEKSHLNINDSVFTLARCFAFDTNNFYLTYDYEDYYEAIVMDMSTDGGETFERIIFDGIEYRPGLGVSWMGMYNENIGALVLYDGAIYTKDNWKTLDYYVFGDDEYVFGRSGFFIDSTSIATTIDGTRNNLIKIDFVKKEITQYSEPIPPPEGEEVEALLDMCMVNDTLGYGCGGQLYGNGYLGRDIIFKTTDRGKTWNIIYKNLKEDTFGTQKIACETATHIMAVGSWGKIIESTDGGETWEYLEGDDGFTIGTRIAFAGSYPIVSSLEGGIYRYEEVTSVSEPSGSGISIVPNPAEDYIEISLGIHRDSKGACPLVSSDGIAIYDVLGNVVWKSNSVASQTTQRSVSTSERIDISHLPRGVYFVRVGDEVEKFIKL